jgi:hypothetical protein
MEHKDLDFNEFDTYYTTYTQERRRLIEEHDQFHQYYFELGLKMPKVVFDAFIYDDIGLILCSE